jgi:hypothetical protein
MKTLWPSGILLSVAAFAVAARTSVHGNEELCRSAEFKEAFLDGQKGLVIDSTRPSPRLVAYGKSVLPCLGAIAEKGGSVFSIQGCLEQTHDCRTWALGAIRMIGTPEARAYLSKYLGTTSEKDLRLATIGALGALKEQSARSRLLGLLTDPDTDVRAEAIVALGAIGEKDDYRGMREAAVLLPDNAFYRSLHGFRILGDPRALEDLKPRVQTIADPTIRLAVAMTLESWRTSIADEAQTLMALRSKRGEDLYKAIQGCQGQSEELRAALFESLRSEDPRARAESIAALGKMQMADDFDRLLKATLELPEQYVVLGAKGLELLNDTRAIAPLEKYATGIKDGFRRNQVQGVIERLKRNAIQAGATSPQSEGRQ